ncbi:hypothetical protein A9K55_009107 [Cordyceps militaris]|uniref:Uncharacterized protein n=1 Tax=Cordyceps militaris TaxID=73501 RepID=A0A2H4SJA1_CORMI|nr:hypothetical protein A9K55_009107 [Cordyceps militaris]
MGSVEFLPLLPSTEENRSQNVGPPLHGKSEHPSLISKTRDDTSTYTEPSKIESRKPVVVTKPDGRPHDATAPIRGTRKSDLDVTIATERATSRQGQAADMASDDDYMAFLNKANKDADEAHARASETARGGGGTRAQLKTLDAGQTAPQGIVSVCKEAVYTSDADEPFVPVSLKYAGAGSLPDEEEFAKLIHHWDVAQAEITIMDPLDWDADGKYTAVLEAVRDASKGNDVRVYRVVRDKTRVEYWVVTRESERIVGAKALAIES